MIFYFKYIKEKEKRQLLEKQIKSLNACISDMNGIKSDMNETKANTKSIIKRLDHYRVDLSEYRKNKGKLEEILYELNNES